MPRICILQRLKNLRATPGVVVARKLTSMIKAPHTPTVKRDKVARQRNLAWIAEIQFVVSSSRNSGCYFGERTLHWARIYERGNGVSCPALVSGVPRNVQRLA